MILIAAALVPILFFLSEWFKTRRLHRRKSGVGWSRFREMTLVRNLTPEQTEILEQMVKAGELRDPEMIVTHPALFEVALDRWMSKAPSSRNIAVVRDLREVLGFGLLPIETPLISTRQFAPGDRIRILFSPDGEPISTVIDQLDDVEWSARKVEGLRVSVGDVVIIHYTRIGDGEYRIVARVRKLTKQMVRFEHSMEFEQFQMRNWVRVAVSVSAVVALPSEGSPQGEGESHPAWLVDVSGGGASFKSESLFGLGTDVILSFSLRNHRFRNILSHVVRVQRGEPLTTHSVEFLELGTTEREKLIRFVFDRQRYFR